MNNDVAMNREKALNARWIGTTWKNVSDSSRFLVRFLCSEMFRDDERKFEIRIDTMLKREICVVCDVAFFATLCFGEENKSKGRRYAIEVLSERPMMGGENWN